jgi:hypothetical protein
MELGKLRGVTSSVFKSWSAFFITILLISFAPTAHADGMGNDALKKLLGSGKAIIKPIEDDTLRLTTNKDQIIRLEKDAASVIVNNPNHAQVMLDSPRLLIVQPRNPGATSFKVLDARGNIILEKQIIVSNVRKHYVRIRRMCQAGDGSCAPDSYFYCPGGCYEVTAVRNMGGTATPPPPTAAPGTQYADDDSEPPEPPQEPLQEPVDPASTPTPDPDNAVDDQ